MCNCECKWIHEHEATWYHDCFEGIDIGKGKLTYNAMAKSHEKWFSRVGYKTGRLRANAYNHQSLFVFLVQWLQSV